MNEGWWVLVVSAGGAVFEQADDLAGLRTSEAATVLFARYGEKVGLSLIGPAGQMLMNIAGICNTDPEGRPTRLNARGGVGAAMGVAMEGGLIRRQHHRRQDGLPGPDRQGQRYAVEIIRGELQFSVRAGQPGVERLPEWMRAEPLPPHNASFDVPEEALARMWDEADPE